MNQREALRVLVVCIPLILMAVPSATPQVSQTATPIRTLQSSTASPFKHIVTLVEENHPLDGPSGLVGNLNDAPYVNQLIQNGSLLTNYHDTANTGSLSQYLGMISGNSPCADDPADGPSCVQYGRTVVDNIEVSGRTWKAFMEDYPLSCPVSPPIMGRCNASGCFVGPYSYGYLDNHNPFIYYPAIANNSSRCANILPADDHYGWGNQTTPNLLLDYLNSSSPANYIFFVPTHCDSFHGPFGPTVWPCDEYTCDPTNDPVTCLHNQVKAGDHYLSKIVPKILSSKLFQSGDAVLNIAFDEPNSHPTTPGICPSPTANVPTGSETCPIFGFWIGPMIKKGYVSNTLYTHYSLLKTVESAWQLPALTGNDRDAMPMIELFTVPFPPPKAGMTLNPTNPVTGQLVSFAGSVAGGAPPYSYEWRFGDGNTSSGANTTYIYTSSYTFDVTVTVTDSNSQSGSFSQRLQVTNPLTSSFDYSPPGLFLGTLVTFVSHVSGGQAGYTYSWNFGDDSKATAADPTHTYAKTGTYTVSLTVSDLLLHSSTSNRNVIVSPFVLSFSSDPPSPHVGENVTFTATISGGGTPPFTYRWDFGDRVSVSGIAGSVKHVYSIDDTYAVRLEASDSLGKSTQLTQTITILPTPETIIVTFVPTSPIIGESVTFTSTVSGGTAPYKLDWNFGDGSSNIGNSTIHTYSSEGSYIVKVNVTDSSIHVQNMIASRNISVSRTLCSSAESCNFRIDNPAPTTGQSVLFEARADGGVSPYTFTWEFGDGATAAGSTASHSYSTNGIYTVKLTIHDNAGHLFQTSSNLTVPRSQTANLPIPPFIQFLLIAIGSGAAISGIAFKLRSRILRRFRD